jgi:hypothetical protein
MGWIHIKTAVFDSVLTHRFFGIFVRRSKIYPENGNCVVYTGDIDNFGIHLHAATLETTK